MKNICDELFYDMLPKRNASPQNGASFLCKKTVLSLAKKRLLGQNTKNAEKLLRQYRDYADKIKNNPTC